MKLQAGEKILDYKAWEPRYLEIAGRLRIDTECDMESSKLLSKLIGGNGANMGAIRNSMNGKLALVLGAGPSLERNLLSVRGTAGFISIAADGATSAYREILGRYPDFIVTDLDGYRVEEEVEASRRGSSVVVHAHCDNVRAIRSMVPLMLKTIGSTQNTPLSNVYNFGGFTDGDRAAFFAVEMGCKGLVLAGMDLGEIIGRFSKSFVMDVQRKIEKLKIAGELLEWLTELNPAVEYYNMTGGTHIRNYRDITPDDFRKLI